jgi:hypothetical protein
MPLLGQVVATQSRRVVFLRYLRSVGSGAPCVPWPWAARADLDSYTRISDGTGRVLGAHRWVWEQVNGPIPDGLEVCHTCDNPGCVRPSHLWLGTHSDNIRDGYAKGRMHGNRKNHVSGERHHQAKLTSPQVLEIRRRCDAGEVHLRLAREFGVSHVTIDRIAKRTIWRSLPEETDAPTPAAQA